MTINTAMSRAGDLDQWLKRLPCKEAVVSSIPSTFKKKIAMSFRTSKANINKVENED